VGAFRVAATLLVNALAATAAARGEMADAVLDSLQDRIAVVDRHGTIIAVNAVWTDFWKQRPDVSPRDIGPGANYLSAWRHLAKPSPEMLTALDGIEAVCAGTSDSFHAEHNCELLGEQRTCVTTVRPLRRPDGGAVILQRDVTAVKTPTGPQLRGEGELSHRFAGAMPADISAKRRAESAAGEITAKLVAAQEEERTRIARELHDDLGQQLALMAAQLDASDRVRPRSLGQLRHGLSVARRTLQDIALTVHALSHRLHPGKLKVLGLLQTLQSLCRDVSRESKVAVGFEAREVPPGIPDDTALCLFRVAQEALQNAVKHSGARSVSMRLTRVARKLVLRVADDGKGFDMLASHQAGLGLLTMRERVELCGGSLTIETVTGHGTAIEATVPLAPADHAITQ
jgi:signal transduction histidine kinase